MKPIMAGLVQYFCAVAIFVATLPCCGALLLQGSRSSEPQGSAYPVSKVVALLRDMKENLEKEQDGDEETYEKLACWCETGKKEKTKSVADSEAHISDLEATIEKMAALSATLKVDIEGLAKEIAKNQKSLDVAIALRQKQKADFIAEETETVQSIQALNAAVAVLSKHHGGDAASLLTDRAVVQAVALAEAQAQRRAALLTQHQQRVLDAFVQKGQAPPDGEHLGSAPTFKQAYQPQSGEIFGILGQMKATFESDLKESQTEEVDAQQAYSELKAAKEEEIKTGQASLEDKKQQLAGADETLAQSKNDRTDTQEVLAADKKYMTELKIKCSLTDKEWEERQKVRQDELTAVSQAIGVLSSDDARELFSKVYNAPKSFLQRQRTVSAHGRVKAVEVLSKVAAKTRSGIFSKLIASIKLDAFTRVKKAIDDMVLILIKEKEDETKHRDMCISELNSNERATAKELHSKKNLESKIDDLRMDAAGLNSTINQLQSEISDLQLQRKHASENREKEKAEYHAVIADQKAAEGLLQEVLHALELRYSQMSDGAALMQQSASGAKSKQSPQPRFKVYEKNGQAPGVLSLIQHIIQNTQQLQREVTASEEAAQDAYTMLVHETTRSVEAKQDAILDRQSEKAQVEKDLQQTQGELDGTDSELEALAKGEGDLHANCDYTLKNFQVRQEARDQEVQALRQARAFLSGME